MPGGLGSRGFSYAQAPGLRSGGVVVLDAKGREAPLLETSRYGRMVSSRSLGAAYCEVVERMPVVKPDAESEDSGMPSRRSSLPYGRVLRRRSSCGTPAVRYRGQDRSGVRRSNHAWVRHHCAISPVS